MKYVNKIIQISDKFGVVIRLTQFVNTIRLILRNSLLIFSLYVITHNVYLCLVRIFKEIKPQLRT